MAFPYIQTLLGVSFAFMWIFIGGMILRDRLQEIRDQRLDPETLFPELGPPEPRFLRRLRRAPQREWVASRATVAHHL